MRKNLQNKIMLSILAGSLALGFVYAPPAFAEDVLIADTSYTAPDGTQGTYDLDADGTNNGTNYGDEKDYTSISLPTGPIDKFTVTAGNGGNIVKGSTGGKGGSISLSAIGNAINKGVSITAGNGGYSELGTSTGVAGGDVMLTFTNVVNGNITASAGNGGYIDATYDSNGNGGDGGDFYTSGDGGDGSDGGDVTLTFNDIVVTDSISLTSGTNGTGNGASSTPGNGGSVTFEAESISGTTSTSDIAINLTKKDGDITFDVGTLNIADNTVTIKTKNRPNSDVNDNNIVICKTGYNHIDTLYLTGNGNINVGNNIQIGSLTINDGTINDNNWKNYNNLKTTETAAEIGGDGIIFSTDSEIEWSKGLTDADNLTTPGNLTKTGAGMLKLTGSTYDYTGLTVVEKGTIDASISELTNSKGLTLFGGATFIANTDQDWYGNQLAVYDNGSDNSATYKGNLNAQNSNLYFIASGDNTNPLLKVINNGTDNNGNVNIAGSNYNLGLTGDKFLDIGSKLTLIEADGTINADNLEPGSGIKVGSTIKQDITTNVEVSVDDSGSTEKLIATVSGALATDEASAINSGMLGGLAFNLQGADLIAREGMEAAVRSAQLDNNPTLFLPPLPAAALITAPLMLTVPTCWQVWRGAAPPAQAALLTAFLPNTATAATTLMPILTAQACTAKAIRTTPAAAFWHVWILTAAKTGTATLKPAGVLAMPIQITLTAACAMLTGVRQATVRTALTTERISVLAMCKSLMKKAVLTGTANFCGHALKAAVPI